VAKTGGNSVDKSCAGVSDSRPCSSTDPKANQVPRELETYDWRGLDDNRPGSGTDSKSVGVGGGAFKSPANTTNGDV